MVARRRRAYVKGSLRSLNHADKLIVHKLRQVEETIEEEIVKFIDNCKNTIGRSQEEEEKDFNELEDRKEAVRQARDIVDAGNDE